jgi:hypothetical protein
MAMGSFGKVHGSFGCGDAGATPYGGLSGATDWSETVAMIRTIQDPYRKVEVLKSRIRTLKRGPSFPGRAALISDLEAQLRAAERAVREDKEGKAYTEEWRGLGQSSIVLSQVLLVALTGAALAATYTILKRS